MTRKEQITIITKILEAIFGTDAVSDPEFVGCEHVRGFHRWSAYDSSEDVTFTVRFWEWDGKAKCYDLEVSNSDYPRRNAYVSDAVDHIYGDEMLSHILKTLLDMSRAFPTTYKEYAMHPVEFMDIPAK